MATAMVYPRAYIFKVLSLTFCKLPSFIFLSISFKFLKWDLERDRFLLVKVPDTSSLKRIGPCWIRQAMPSSIILASIP